MHKTDKFHERKYRKLHQTCLVTVYRSKTKNYIIQLAWNTRFQWKKSSLSYNSISTHADWQNIRVKKAENMPHFWMTITLNLSLLSTGSFVSRLSRLPPRRSGALPVTSATLALSFTTTMGMINWVHCHTSHRRPYPPPSGLPCLSEFLCSVLWVRHHPYRCPASLVYQFLFPRW